MVTGRWLSGLVEGDEVEISGGIAAFADVAIGTGKTVTLTGAVLTGAQAGNYALASVTTATADIVAPADGLTVWLEGQPATAQTLHKYAIGGAGNAHAVSEEVEGSIRHGRVSLTALVRTNDAKLTVTGEWSTALAAWTTNGVTSTAAHVQTNVSPGFQHRIFSVEDAGDPPALFLRLRALYSP